MELKAGYKQTEVGVVPEEWEVLKVGDVCGCIVPGRNKPRLFNGDIPWITTPDLESGEAVTASRFGLCISRAEAKLVGSKIVPPGSVLMSCAGELGIVAMTKKEIVVNQQLHVFIPTERIEAVFLLNVLAYKKIQIENYGTKTAVPYLYPFRGRDEPEPHCVAMGLLHWLTFGDSSKPIAWPQQAPFQAIRPATGPTGSVSETRTPHIQPLNGYPYLNKNACNSIPVPLPPQPEQRAIAKALSDVDALLGALDRLIVKKRDLKQAAMQQLLTGQTRLPGFHGEWEVKRLGDVFSIAAGKSKTACLAIGGDYWVCDMGSVSTEGRLTASKRTNYCGDFLSRGDLIMPKDDIGGGNIIGKVGYIDANENYVLGDHVYRLRALEGDSCFLAYVINSHRVNSELRKKVIGSAQLGLGRKSVDEQAIQFPPHSEQIAIAAVLTEMDAELAALEQRQSKTRALKQGMMQELLTGRTRLI